MTEFGALPPGLMAEEPKADPTFELEAGLEPKIPPVEGEAEALLLVPVGTLGPPKAEDDEPGVRKAKAEEDVGNCRGEVGERGPAGWENGLFAGAGRERDMFGVDGRSMDMLTVCERYIIAR